MKGKKLLLSALTLAMLGTAVAGGTLLAANAAGGLTVGALTPESGLYVNGTSTDPETNKSVVSYTWEAGSSSNWNRVLVNVTGTTSSTPEVSMSLTSEHDATVTIYLLNGMWDWDASYGQPVYNDNMTAGTAYTKTVTPTNYTAGDEFYIAFYFDMSAGTGVENHIVFDSLTVEGVSYEKTPYSAPVETPDTEFKAYGDWTATNATIAANTLAKLPETDPQFEGAVDNGAGNITLTDSSAAAEVVVPFTEAITAWPNAWSHLHVKFKATGLAQIAGHIEEVAAEDANLFVFNMLDAWNSKPVKSGTEGYYVTSIDLNTYFSGHAGDITKLLFILTPEEGASEASLEIAGMAFGGSAAPAFINDPEYVPELGLGEWVTWSGYTIENGATLETEGTTYTGVKVSYAFSELQAYPNIAADVVNFDAATHPMLHIGFYTDSALTIGVAIDWGMITDTMSFEAGYHEIEVDLSNRTETSFALRLYIDNGTADFAGTKTVIFDSFVFHKDIAVLPEEAKAPLNDTVISVQDGKLSWTFDSKNGGFDNYVSVPVENWYSFNRVLHLNVTLSHATAIGVWGGGNSFGDPATLQMTHKLLPAGTYDLWLDASSTSFTDNGKANNIMIYCDVNNASEGSFIKTVTVNTMEFVGSAELVSSPNGDVVVVDFQEGTATYDAETYEVATDANFENAFVSGSAVTPGMKLYIRLANGTSGVTELVLPVTELNADMITFSTITDSIIRTDSFANYEFRLGEDGEWMQGYGSWGNLEADTEYTIYVRIKATETAFASEEISFTVKTLAKGGTTPGGDGGDEQPETPKKKGCFGVIEIPAAIMGIGVLAGAAVLLTKKKHND